MDGSLCWCVHFNYAERAIVWLQTDPILPYLYNIMRSPNPLHLLSKFFALSLKTFPNYFLPSLRFLEEKHSRKKKKGEVIPSPTL